MPSAEFPMSVCCLPARAVCGHASKGASAFHLLGLRSDIPDILAAADIFALTSSWEGLPLAVIEAMAAGLPVVATQVGSGSGSSRAWQDWPAGFRGRRGGVSLKRCKDLPRIRNAGKEWALLPASALSCSAYGAWSMRMSTSLRACSNRPAAPFNTAGRRRHPYFERRDSERREHPRNSSSKSEEI